MFVKSNKIYTLINAKTSETICSFDLSEYALNEKWIVFSAKNPDGDLYTIIMNSDGNFVGNSLALL